MAKVWTIDTPELTEDEICTVIDMLVRERLAGEKLGEMFFWMIVALLCIPGAFLVGLVVMEIFKGKD